MENCWVPIEVWRALLACTLVCSAWQRRSYYHCYKDVHIPGYSKCMSLLDALRKHPERRGWVQALSIHIIDEVLVPSLSRCRNITSLSMGGNEPLTTYWHIFRAMPQLTILWLETYDDYERFQLQQIEWVVGQMWPKVCLQNLEKLSLQDTVWSSQDGLPLSRFFGTSVTNLTLKVDHRPLSDNMVQFLSSLNSLHSLTLRDPIVVHQIEGHYTRPFAQALSSVQHSILQSFELSLQLNLNPVRLHKLPGYGVISYRRTKADFLDWIFADVKPFQRLRSLRFVLNDHSADEHAASTWWESQIRNKLQVPNLNIEIYLWSNTIDDDTHLWTPAADLAKLVHEDSPSETSSSSMD
ncbi:hypothetical protein C8Q79DRAFT_158134 [Trametes meyenii]|nr:hypothetical protein C8Q79DRAFT_158134 [Trametes meyenii]